MRASGAVLLHRAILSTASRALAFPGEVAVELLFGPGISFKVRKEIFLKYLPPPPPFLHPPSPRYAGALDAENDVLAK